MLTLSDEETVAEFGGALEFWTWDRQPMDVFLKLAAIDHSNTSTVVEAVRDLVLDENGKPIIKGDVTLPTKVMMRVITAVVESLGK